MKQRKKKEIKEESGKFPILIKNDGGPIIDMKIERKKILRKNLRKY
jgi:hypothetical protein